MSKTTITINQAVISHLERFGATLGGMLARRVGAQLDKKESNVERRCRELVNDGILEADYVKINGKGNEVDRYRLSEKISSKEKASLQAQDPLRKSQNGCLEGVQSMGQESGQKMYHLRENRELASGAFQAQLFRL